MSTSSMLAKMLPRLFTQVAIHGYLPWCFVHVANVQVEKNGLASVCKQGHGECSRNLPECSLLIPKTESNSGTMRLHARPGDGYKSHRKMHPNSAKIAIQEGRKGERRADEAVIPYQHRSRIAPHVIRASAGCRKVTNAPGIAKLSEKRRLNSIGELPLLDYRR